MVIMPFLCRVVAILSGGNIDTTVLGRAIERGLAVDGRLIRIEVVVSDRPGGSSLPFQSIQPLSLSSQVSLNYLLE